MKLKNNNIKIEMDQFLINSIKYKGKEILNITKKWTKKSPILFPAIGLNKEYKIKDNIYKVPKHGFWNDIDFKMNTSQNGITLSGAIKHPSYPFYIEADQYIIINKNKISYITTFTGKDIPIQFGYHPAFNYDLGGLKIKEKNVNVIYKDLTIGKIHINVNKVLDLPWDKVDTFIFELNELKIENEKYNILVRTNMKYIAVWTNGDKFICLEPWSNLPALVTPDDNSNLSSKSFNMDIIIEEKE